MNRYLVVFLFAVLCTLRLGYVDARTVKKCIAGDGSTTYATSCPSDSTESEETLKIYDTESPEPGNAPGVGSKDAGDESSDGSGGITVVGEDSGSKGSSGGGSLSSGGGATGGGSAGGAPSGGGAGSGDSGGGTDGQASSDSSGDTGTTSSSSTESAASSTATDSTSSTDSDSTTDGPTGSSTSSPSGTASNAPAGSPDSDTVSSSSTGDSDSTTSSSSDVSTTDSGTSDPDTTTVIITPSGTARSNAPAYTVSSITNNGATNEIIIDGSEFGTGPNVILVDRFQNGAAGGNIPLKNLNNPACLTDVTGLNVGAVTGPIIGCWSDYGPNGEKPIYSNVSANSGTTSMSVFRGFGIPTLLNKDLNDINEFFITFWAHVPSGNAFPGGRWLNGTPTPGEFSLESSWKMSWIHDGKVDSFVANICIPTHVGGGLFYLAGNDLNVLTGFDGNEFWSWDNWTRISTYMKANENDPTGPGKVIFQAVSLDKGYYSRTSDSARIHDEDGPSPKKFSELNIPGWVRFNSKTVVLYDDIYVATGPNAIARVELGNSSNYYTNTRIVIQPAVSWNDSEIKISTTSDAFSSFGGTKYLYITDNEGKVNMEGFPVP